MLLAIDVGNTNVVFAVYENEELRCQWRSATQAPRTADEYAVWLTQLMNLRNIAASDITDAIIATVVPRALFDLRALCRTYFDIDPVVVGDGAELGIGILIDKPEDVGSDRLVNAVAAHITYDGPLIILDFGTATTFDVVDGEGNYRGGVISPGINLSLEALHMAAAKLPHIAVARPQHAIGRGTTEAMQSGVYWGYVGLIEGLVKRIADELKSDTGDSRDPVVIGTGGLAPLFATGTDIIQHIDPDLTMRGLVEIHRRTRKA
jgi:type III pantothenate kinase